MCTITRELAPRLPPEGGLQGRDKDRQEVPHPFDGRRGGEGLIIRMTCPNPIIKHIFVSQTIN